MCCVLCRQCRHAAVCQGRADPSARCDPCGHYSSVIQWVGFAERVSICHFVQLYLIFLFPTSHVNTSVWEFCKTSIFTPLISNTAKSYMQIIFRDIALFGICSWVQQYGESYQVGKKLSCLYTQYLELFKYSIYVFLRISIISVLVNLKVCTSLKSCICISILNVAKSFTTDRLDIDR